MKDFKDYVCTIEQAKKLKELLVIQDQDSLYYYLSDTDILCATVSGDETKFVDNYAAFTSQELGELIKKNMPSYNTQNGVKRDVVYQSINDEYYYKFHYGPLIPSGYTNRKEFDIEDIENEAQARAEFLIYLLENKKKEVKNETNRLV